MTDRIQADFDLLDRLAAQVRQEGEAVERLHRKVVAQTEALAQGWEGESAGEFQDEMANIVIPALRRLYLRLERAGEGVLQIKSRMRAAEEEAARLLAGAAAAGGVANRADVTSRIEQHEGRRDRAYLDTEGHPTVGVGFNLDRPDARRRIEELGLNYDDVRRGRVRLTNDQINRLRDADVDHAVRDARQLFPSFDRLTPARQRALTDMAFNLGRTRLAQFHRLRDAVANEDWERAAREMRNSRWARQVGQRADHDIADMRGQ